MDVILLLDRGKEDDDNDVLWYNLFPQLLQVLLVLIAIRVAQKNRLMTTFLVLLTFVVQLLMQALVAISYTTVKVHVLKHIIAGLFYVLTESALFVLLMISIMVIGLYADEGFESFIINMLTSCINISVLISQYFGANYISIYIKNHQYSESSVYTVITINGCFTASALVIGALCLAATYMRQEISDIETPSSTKKLTEQYTHDASDYRLLNS